MNDLENHLKSQNIMKTCETVAHYVCKKKSKQLVSFLLVQYGNHYLNDNVECIHFLHDRIRTIRNHSFSGSKRIVRVSMCELFVVLLQLNRQSKIKMMTTKRDFMKHSSVPQQFPIHFRNKVISNSSFMNGIKNLCNLDDTHEKVIQQMVFSCKVEYDPTLITHCVSTLFRYKAIVKVAKIKQQPEMEGLKDQLGDHFISVLAFICLALLSGREDRVKRSYCEYIFDLIMIKPSFNLTLLAFSVMACPHFNKVYCTKNTFYHPIVLQCAMKVDYIYKDLCEHDYPKFSIEDESVSLRVRSPDAPSDSKRKDEDEEDDFDVLFTIPEKKAQPQRPLEASTDMDPRQNIKTIILKTNSQPKDKNMYNISKRLQ